MRVRVVHPSELSQAELGRWHEIQQKVPSLAHPFLSPEYAVAVGHHRPQARVAVLEEGCAAVGFFPFEKRRFGVGVPISGWLSAGQGVILTPGVILDSGELMRQCGLAAWRFDNLIEDGALFKHHETATVPSPVIDVTDGFEAYYAGLRARVPRMCRELERKARKLGREIGELHLVSDVPDPKLLRLLIAWKSDQYRRTNHVDRFAQPWVGNLAEELLTIRTDALTGMLSVLYAGDQPVAIQFGLRADNLIVGWFTGYDCRFARYSPGIIQIRILTEHMAQAGVDKLQMGKGAKRYTEALKNHDTFLGEGVVTSPTVAGTAHRIRLAANSWALRTAREHRALHDMADIVMRRTGLASQTYGRI